ncbi:MAG: type I methionyl aminopeptidase [Acidobacteria bacterium]|nr:MAG: type I methionyl aminopeptidase [Acidobacteriota bacterium]RLE32024.1 MAG: type I methionyl aminopeptidase [Acidobacteriota bacterium]
MILLKSTAEIDAMDQANRLVHRALVHVREAAAPGVTTWDLDQKAEALIRSEGGIPAFKGYRGFPGTLCISINDVIVHGIPSRSVRLREGDLVSVDCGTVMDGFFGDAAISFGVGRVSEEVRRLMETTQKCLEDAVSEVRPNNRLGDVGAAVQRRAESAGYGVVRDFVGHGIGRSLHEDPQVPNYGVAGRGQVMKPGLVIAIEPMITAGSWRVKVDDDGWTARTEDGRIAAHFEFSVAVTENGARVLGVEE